ncbi:hypothetical protein QBC45DRAFT_426439 [Copromyces sp. CBS 386.78]|nr:hypothetical protein QBC45DRAFT_426439 [Copromyces sp. CBS 386.78]
MKESRRLEEEEDRLMQELFELQSHLLRIREQKRHMKKNQKELFDRGMVEHEKEVRELEAQRSPTTSLAMRSIETLNVMPR